MRPITFVRMRTLRKRMNEPCRRKYTHSSATPTTANWESQYVHCMDTAMECDDSAQLWSDSSQSPVARRSTSTIPRALSNAARSSRSATPRATW